MSDNWILGNEPVPERLNVRREISEIRRDPMRPFVDRLRKRSQLPVLADDIGLYEEAYEFFRLSYERFLPELSIAWRWRNTAYYAWKNHRPYTPSERVITAKFRPISAFFHYDFWNCLVHSRILCDRAIRLTRHIMRGRQLPSFTSFAEHKKFFIKGLTPGPDYDEYACKLRDDTAWFDLPLKHVRDKYFVHVMGDHMRFFGHADGGDLQVILHPIVHGSATPLSAPPIMVSVRRLARDICGFLDWLARYGRRSLKAAA